MTWVSHHCKTPTNARDVESKWCGWFISATLEICIFKMYFSAFSPCQIRNVMWGFKATSQRQKSCSERPTDHPRAPHRWEWTPMCREQSQVSLLLTPSSSSWVMSHVSDSILSTCIQSLILSYPVLYKRKLRLRGIMFNWNRSYFNKPIKSQGSLFLQKDNVA